MTTSGSRLAARIVLDTSAYTRLSGGDARVRAHVAAADVVLLPVTVVGELEAGFAAGTRSRANLQKLEEFLELPVVAIIPIDRDVARKYGQVFAQLRRAGTPIAFNDMWIAATTMAVGGHLLTFDGDFGRVAALDCTVLTP